MQRIFVSSTPEEGVFRFISVRLETLNDIRRNITYATDTLDFDAHYKTIQHTTPPLHNILEKRLLAFFNEYDNPKDTSPEFKLYIEILKNTFKIHDKFFENLEFFNYNIRLFLHSKLSLSLQILFRFLQRNITFNLDSFDRFHKTLFMRNLFLNGRLFLKTESTGLSLLKQGVSLYNIFYFDYHNIENKRNNGKWRGLCTTRLMQLMRRTTKTTKNNLKKTLHDNFGYPLTYVEICIDRLINFGFIESYTDKKFKNVLFRMTNKGKMALDYIFSDLDIIYYLCLDTPIPNLLIEDKLVNAHNNKVIEFDPFDNIGISSRYPSSSIISTISFLLYLHNVNSDEMKELPDKCKKIFKDPIDFSSKRKIYKRLCLLYNTANDEERNIINKYFSKIGLSEDKREVLINDISSVEIYN